MSRRRPCGCPEVQQMPRRKFTTCPGCVNVTPTEPPAPREIKVAFGKARVQADGSIVYPKRGWEPPPPIEGYERDPGNDWKFIPMWPVCLTRQRVTVIKPCGALNIKMHCKCPQCPLFQQTIKVNDCKVCEHRKTQ